jgi:hypothetical protein
MKPEAFVLNMLACMVAVAQPVNELRDLLTFA